MPSFKDTVSSALPFLGSLLGGPIGSQIGSVISTIITGKEKATDEEIEHAILTAPIEKLAELKKLDNEYQFKLLDSQTAEQQINLEDIKDARETYIKAIQESDNETGFQAIINKPPVILGYLLTLGFFTIVTLIAFIPIQNGAKDIIQVLIGAFTTCWIQAMAFYFGPINHQVRNVKSHPSST